MRKRQTISKKKYYWALSLSQFVFLITLLNLLLYHFPLYQLIDANIQLSTLQGMGVLLSIVCIIFLVSLLLFSLLAILLPFLLKPFVILMVLMNAVATYFLVTYQVILDKTMMGNILNTRSEESFDFLTPTLLIYLLFLGVIPAWLVFKTRIKKGGKLRLVLQLLGSIVVGAVFIYLNATSWLWIDKYARKLGGKILPWSYIINTGRHYSGKLKASKVQQLLPPSTFLDNKKEVLILVIGETARADNFSLYGYPRKTNPLLEKQKDLLVFKDAYSCSTYTTASVACLLSYTEKDPDDYEPLPSYLSRQGVDVIWRSNNWGEPPIKVNEYKDSKELNASCKGDDCYLDGVLLTGLKQRIEGSKKNKVFVVLHTKGSHGPSYFSRYTKAFEVFKPVCKSVELSQCTSQALQNAYDNSILYTDYFLHKTIRLLESLGEVPTAMIYISDHGESLGEFGLYLHGTPYTIAPDVQKKVPFLVWMSTGFQSLKGMKNYSTEQVGNYSQANIFHSVLGALGVQSQVYDEKLDIFNNIGGAGH